ncbi:MAG: hypothetical protein V4760_05805 [Bdellovibrionota bacterium]
MSTEKGTIGVGSSLEPADVIRLTTEHNFHHVVQKDGISFDTEMAVARTMSTNLNAFLDHPLQTILGLSDVDAGHLPSLVIKAAVDERKSNTIEQFDNYLKGLSGVRPIIDEAMMIADELYTNGAKLGFDPARLSKGAKLVRPGTVEFFARTDGLRLVLGVRDSYGLLKFEQVLSRIANCFANGMAGSIKQGEGGAGIGSFMVFNACVSYYAGVERGKRSVVCVALPVGISRREGNALPKNIHLASD